MVKQYCKNFVHGLCVIIAIILMIIAMALPAILFINNYYMSGTIISTLYAFIIIPFIGRELVE